MADSPCYAFFGHHKAATTTFLRLIEQVCWDLGLTYRFFNSPKAFQNNLAQTIQEEKIDFFAYINADGRFIPNLSNMKGFHLIRDPRDTVVSAYFSHLKTHGTENWPELIEHRKRLQSLSPEEGLLLDMEFTACLPTDGVDLNLFETMRQWDYSQSNILEVKFEDFISNPYRTTLNIFRFLGLVDDTPFRYPHAVSFYLKKLFRRVGKKIYSNRQSHPYLLPYWRLLMIAHEYDFSKIAKRRPGQENLNSHLRKGVAGDWKNHFTEKHKAIFKKKYSDLLIQLGYEEDDKW